MNSAKYLITTCAMVLRSALLGPVLLAFFFSTSTAQQLFNFEEGLEGFAIIDWSEVPNMTTPPTLAQVSNSDGRQVATKGESAMALTISENASFTWAASVTFGVEDERFEAMAALVDSGAISDYEFRFDVTILEEEIPHGTVVLQMATALQEPWHEFKGILTYTSAEGGVSKTVSVNYEEVTFDTEQGFFGFNFGYSVNGVSAEQPLTVYIDNLRVVKKSDQRIFTFEEGLEGFSVVGWSEIPNMTNPPVLENVSNTEEKIVSTEGESAAALTIYEGTAFTWAINATFDDLHSEYDFYKSLVESGEIANYELKFDVKILEEELPAGPVVLQLALSRQEPWEDYKGIWTYTSTEGSVTDTITVGYDETALDPSEYGFFGFTIGYSVNGPTAEAPLTVYIDNFRLVEKPDQRIFTFEDSLDGFAIVGWSEIPNIANPPVLEKVSNTEEKIVATEGESAAALTIYEGASFTWAMNSTFGDLHSEYAFYKDLVESGEIANYELKFDVKILEEELPEGPVVLQLALSRQEPWEDYKGIWTYTSTQGSVTDTITVGYEETGLNPAEAGFFGFTIGYSVNGPTAEAPLTVYLDNFRLVEKSDQMIFTFENGLDGFGIVGWSEIPNMDNPPVLEQVTNTEDKVVSTEGESAAALTIYEGTAFTWAMNSTFSDLHSEYSFYKSLVESGEIENYDLQFDVRILEEDLPSGPVVVQLAVSRQEPWEDYKGIWTYASTQGSVVETISIGYEGTGLNPSESGFFGFTLGYSINGVTPEEPLTLYIDNFRLAERSLLPWSGLATGEQADDSMFGSFYVGAESSWIYHSSMGWLYVGLVSDPENMWIYSFALDTWTWSTLDLWPVVYDAAEGDYLYFIAVPDVGVWIYHYATSTWAFRQ